MGTQAKITDERAVIDHAYNRTPIDPEVERRIRERGRKAREETLKRCGVQEIGVQLTRETRDEW